MALKVIAAVAMNGVIGQKGALPFRLSDDMQLFKKKTLGHPVVSGSTTYFSIPTKFRPLRGRENIVLTRHPDKLIGEMVTIYTDFADIAERAKRQDLWIIGGAEVYRQALPLAQELHLTRVQAVIPGDALFPEWDPGEWQLVSQEQMGAGEKNEYGFFWEIWKRLKEPASAR
jgi:dihydrofolate reductase